MFNCVAVRTECYQTGEFLNALGIIVFPDLMTFNSVSDTLVGTNVTTDLTLVVSLVVAFVSKAVPLFFRDIGPHVAVPHGFGYKFDSEFVVFFHKGWFKVLFTLKNSVDEGQVGRLRMRKQTLATCHITLMHSVVVGCTQDQHSSHLTYQDILWHYPLYYLLFMQHPYPMGSEETLCVITTAHLST